MKRLALTALVLALAPAAALAQDDIDLRINPGMWENTSTISMQMDMNGQTMDIPAQTQSTSECLSDEDARFSLEDVTEQGCSVSNVNQTGNSVSFSMSCDQNGVAMTGEMTMTVSDDGNTTSGEMTLNGSQPGMGTMTMNGTFEGARSGDC